MRKTNLREIRKNSLLSKRELQFFFDELFEEKANSSCRWEEYLVTRDICILAFFGILGMKMQEVIDLDVNDVENFTAETYITIKGNKERTIKAEMNLSKQIGEYIELRNIFYKDTGALFLSNTGKRFSHKPLSRIVEKWADKYGEYITAEILRQSCINRVYDITGDLYAVADFFAYDKIDVLKELIIPQNYDEDEIIRELDDGLF